METSYMLHLFVMFMALVYSVSPAAIPDFHDQCLFNDRTYAIGEQFHPLVEVMGRHYERVCSSCECQPTTIVQCDNIQCPPTDCDKPERLGGRCCPVCLQPDISVGDDSQPCVFEGLRYPHGEDVFHPPSMIEAFENRTANTNAPNPFCIECTCNDSNVQCNDVSDKCPPLNCDESEAVIPERSCCPSCPSAPTEDMGGCLDPTDTSADRQKYEEGQSWNPTYPGQGPIECINCTCINSTAKCARINFPCPDVPPCGPNDPVQPIILCCPKCTPVSLSTPPPTATNSSRPPTTYVPPVISPESEAYLPSEDVSPDLTPCKHDFTIRLYKHLTDDAMAIEDLDAGTVEIYSWTRTGSGVQRDSSEVSSIDFHPNDDYLFVGWTIQRRVNGLTGKPAKRQKIDMCTENCSLLVVNMLRPVPELTCKTKST